MKISELIPDIINLFKVLPEIPDAVMEVKASLFAADKAAVIAQIDFTKYNAILKIVEKFYVPWFMGFMCLHWEYTGDERAELNCLSQADAGDL